LTSSISEAEGLPLADAMASIEGIILMFATSKLGGMFFPDTMTSTPPHRYFQCQEILFIREAKVVVVVST
jgi:hypothetical protein